MWQVTPKFCHELHAVPSRSELHAVLSRSGVHAFATRDSRRTPTCAGALWTGINPTTLIDTLATLPSLRTVCLIVQRGDLGKDYIINYLESHASLKSLFVTFTNSEGHWTLEDQGAVKQAAMQAGVAFAYKGTILKGPFSTRTIRSPSSDVVHNSRGVNAQRAHSSQGPACSKDGILEARLRSLHPTLFFRGHDGALGVRVLETAPVPGGAHDYAFGLH